MDRELVMRSYTRTRGRFRDRLDGVRRELFQRVDSWSAREERCVDCLEALFTQHGVSTEELADPILEAVIESNGVLDKRFIQKLQLVLRRRLESLRRRFDRLDNLVQAKNDRGEWSPRDVQRFQDELETVLCKLCVTTSKGGDEDDDDELVKALMERVSTNSVSDVLQLMRTCAGSGAALRSVIDGICHLDVGGFGPGRCWRFCRLLLVWRGR
eukprot:TRINITY_DN61728_c0_g1_i1.p1 TRINITY_DN61728_c0_g1~~TRINITY_DN61728_c0_g1_i1.p1  ORF type:complete len:213 (+),score=7.86 TRINITY_DN61728_c0_g1_i1:55-693(+)